MASALLSRIAAAYLQRERQRTGVTQADQAAQEAGDASMLRRAQAARVLQQMRFEDESQPVEMDYRRALAEQARAHAVQYTTPKPQKAVERTVDLGDRIRTVYTDGTVTEEAKGAAPRDHRPSVSLELPIAVQDKQTGQMTYVTRADVIANPSRYVPPPTTAERNVASGVSASQQALKQSRERANPVLQDLGSRITAINAGREGGVMDRGAGLVRRAAGAMGADSAADLYTTGVRGFVPLFARSVGHVGVLTELDVKRTEDLFPRIGDAAAVTGEKLARLQRIMAGQEPMPFQWEHPEYNEQGITQPAAPPTQPAAPGGGGFRVVGRRPKP